MEIVETRFAWRSAGGGDEDDGELTEGLHLDEAKDQVGRVLERRNSGCKGVMAVVARSFGVRGGLVDW